MAVGLRPVTGDNPDDLAELKVGDDRRGCVAPSVYSIAQARVYPEWQPMGSRTGALYRRLGFQDAGRIEGGEIVYRLALAGQGA